MIISSSKEFKIFSVKVDSDTLTRSKNKTLEFKYLDYFDITDKIKDSVRNPEKHLILAYQFDSI